MGNQFSTDCLAMVGPILMRPKADPHTILILIQYWKIRALWRTTFANTRIADFGLFWSKYPSFFCGHFFPLLRNFWKLQGIEPKINLVHTNNPNIFTKGSKNGSKNLGWIVNSDLTSWQNMIVNIFLLGDTACWSWICCAAQFPHCDSEPVDGPLKMPQINGAKPQWIFTITTCLNLDLVGKCLNENSEQLWFWMLGVLKCWFFFVN